MTRVIYFYATTLYYKFSFIDPEITFANDYYDTINFFL